MKRASKLLWGVVAFAFVVMLPACGDDDVAIVDPEEDLPPTIALATPNGGETVQPDSDLEITWTATDDNGVVGVDLSYTSGGGTQTIATGVTGSSYTWTVPDANLFSVTGKAVATDSAGQTAEDVSDGIFAVVTHSARGYVTSDVCKNCHINYYNDIFASGHPYKLNAVVNGQPPLYPNSAVPDTPVGVGWDDIAYVIGGYGWKARYITADSGWIMTNGMDGVDVQYNIPRSDLGGGLTSEWVGYHATDTERKPYDCGSCHTTGWQDLTENGGVHQDGLIGMEGTWEELGVTCEECHGSGVDHVASQSPSDITIDDTAELCGNCHTRDAARRVLTSGGFIRHHEQYDELKLGGKDSFDCGTCHEPHILTRYGNDAAGGILVTCESCHADKVANNNHNGAPSCINCHMGRATKSARAVHDNEGDVRTHIFTINTSAVDKSAMFVVDPADGKEIAEPFVTLDFACYSCHKPSAADGGDPTQGGSNSTKTLAELSVKATGIHN